MARYYPGLIIFDLVSRAVKENIAAFGLLHLWYGKLKLVFSPVRLATTQCAYPLFHIARFIRPTRTQLYHC